MVLIGVQKSKRSWLCTCRARVKEIRFAGFSCRLQLNLFVIRNEITTDLAGQLRLTLFLQQASK